MKAKELRDPSVEELGKKATELSQELFNLRFQHATGAQQPVEVAWARQVVADGLRQRGHAVPQRGRPRHRQGPRCRAHPRSPHLADARKSG